MRQLAEADSRRPRVAVPKVGMSLVILAAFPLWSWAFGDLSTNRRFIKTRDTPKP
jgi:hypothetical protein